MLFGCQDFTELVALFKMYFKSHKTSKQCPEGSSRKYCFDKMETVFHLVDGSFFSVHLINNAMYFLG